MRRGFVRGTAGALILDLPGHTWSAGLHPASRYSAGRPTVVAWWPHRSEGISNESSHVKAALGRLVNL